jgi:hypothetical protein
MPRSACQHTHPLNTAKFFLHYNLVSWTTQGLSRSTFLLQACLHHALLASSSGPVSFPAPSSACLLRAHVHNCMVAVPTTFLFIRSHTFQQPRHFCPPRQASSCAVRSDSNQHNPHALQATNTRALSPSIPLALRITQSGASSRSLSTWWVTIIHHQITGGRVTGQALDFRGRRGTSGVARQRGWVISCRIKMRLRLWGFAR